MIVIASHDLVYFDNHIKHILALHEIKNKKSAVSYADLFKGNSAIHFPIKQLLRVLRLPQFIFRYHSCTLSEAIHRLASLFRFDLR